LIPLLGSFLRVPAPISFAVPADPAYPEVEVAEDDAVVCSLVAPAAGGEEVAWCKIRCDAGDASSASIRNLRYCAARRGLWFVPPVLVPARYWAPVLGKVRFSLFLVPCRERLGLLNFDGDGLFLWLGEASVMACREVRIDGDVP